MANIKEIAQAANVSTATVSHVINGTRHVSQEVQLRVLEVMERLNYQPSAVARGLRTKRTNTLALIIPDITNPYFSDFTRGFQDAADEKGFLVVVCNTDRLIDRELRFVETMWQQRVDGIVMNPSKITADDLKNIVIAKIPVVMIGSQIEHDDFDIVMVDNISGGYDAVQYLCDLGHHRIGLVCGLRTTSSALLRYQGYLKALRSNDLPFDEQLVVEGEITYEGGYQCMRQLLSVDIPPTAVFAVSDVMALGARTAVEDAGLKIPENISLIGFDDIPEVSRTRPKLTTIAQPKYKMGQVAARILFDQIENDNSLSRRKIILEHQLVVRESTKVKL
jgi:DNA-binding LacI/PurR family transcriptional regulator